MTTRPAVHFHIPGSVIGNPAKLALFYGPIMEGLDSLGAALGLFLLDRSDMAELVEKAPGFHIIDHGSFRHPRVLNCGQAYLPPYRNLDPWGIRALSSIAAQSFDPDQIVPDAARAFADGLRRRWVGGRLSRHRQPAVHENLPGPAVAVFLQSEGHRILGDTAYVAMRPMLAAVLARDDSRPILIKPHPFDRNVDTQAYLRDLAAADPRVRLTGANLHDILAKSAAVVTINSAVGIEAMLYNLPLVLCGQSDFHHGAVTARHPGDIGPAIASAEAAFWSHDAFLYWYFHQNCLSGEDPNLAGTVVQRIAATGFDLASLGLAQPKN